MPLSNSLSGNVLDNMNRYRFSFITGITNDNIPTF